jgi:hypothetical protein
LKIRGVTAVESKFVTPNRAITEPYFGQIKHRKAASKQRKKEATAE